jgi:hypothetical protein
VAFSDKIAEFAKIRLMRGIIQGASVVINRFTEPLYTWSMVQQSGSCYWFSDTTERTITTECFAGEYLLLCFYDTGINPVDVQILSATSVMMTIVATESSPFQNHIFPVVSHEWLLTELLKTIAPTATLDYNLPAYDSGYPQIPVLTSSDALGRIRRRLSTDLPVVPLMQESLPTITCSLEDVIKSLRCLYGAYYDVTGTTVRIDYPTTFFSDTLAMEVTPVTEPEFQSDMTHVYNRVTVGYETDDDVFNGQLEFNCKNTFTIANTQMKDKELDLIHPFIGSMYTIEQFLVDKEESTSTTKESDNKVFIFSVHPFNQGTITTKTILYRGTIGGQQIASYGTLPSTAFNIPLSPMRMLMANAAYLGISVWKKTKALVFISTDRNASVRTLCPWETTYASGVTENNALTGQPLSTLMATPLFLPETVSFDTAQKLWTLDAINDNLYKYFTFTDKKTLAVHKFYIKDVTLRLTSINSQSWIGLYDL